MATLMLELPKQRAQNEFNLQRWEKVLEDADLARFEGRIETDRHGHIIMSPPPNLTHGSFQARIAALLDDLIPNGRVLTECPISTADGVKAADVAWASPALLKQNSRGVCFQRAPDICVEVISPGNTTAELEEKKALYFDAGAKEVWTCSQGGVLSFFTSGQPQAGRTSRLCPAFPKRVELR
ncbi:MAG TPA: Uma2 family endonuclease [Candidatus Dormibacteraeota bacterium]|nr:Uma2 family endonuclease [Candidatus Dormibacteraeota bacterium]